MEWALVVGAWVVLLLWRTHALTRDCYEHVQEIIRADAHAGQRTIRARESAAFSKERRESERRFSLDSYRSLYQGTAVTPYPRPSRYVWLLPNPLFIVLPIRPFLRGVVIHWTPLVRYPTPEWFAELTDAVAHFMGLGQDEVERVGTNISRKRTRIVRVSG
jgi:hypothetical protein